MWMALQNSDVSSLSADPADGDLQMPVLVANHHILFLDKKASSSGSIKPPMAAELLDFYTAEQLRMHWLGLGLGMRSVSFRPKPLDPNADPNESDPVTKEGFLLSNVFNRVIRTCFYDVQSHFDGRMPLGRPDDATLAECEKAILEYERFMYRTEFHQVTYVLDSFIRRMSKYMARSKSEADKTDDNEPTERLRSISAMPIPKNAATILREDSKYFLLTERKRTHPYSMHTWAVQHHVHLCR